MSIWGSGHGTTTLTTLTRRALAAGSVGVVVAAVAASAAAVTPGTATLASLTSTGAQVPSGGAFSASLSGDGRYVGFQTSAAGMTAETDGNNANDVFVRDTVAGTTTLVSVDTTGGVGSGASSTMRLAGGAGVTLAAFHSASNDLSPLDTNVTNDVFVRDFADPSAVTELISVNSAGTAGGDSASTSADISNDGRYVVFTSTATNLVPLDTNNAADVFVRDRVAGTTTRVSVATGGAQATGASTFAAISGDGTTVVFRSDATDLVTGDLNNVADFFVHTLATGVTERVSVSTAGVQADAGTGTTATPSINGDGTVVAFASDATTLVADDTNGRSDIFVRDRTAGTTTRVSVDSAGAQHNGTGANIIAAWNPALDDAGRLVVFLSNATNLAAGDTDTTTDVFVHDRAYATTDLVSAAAPGAAGAKGASVTPTISADGLSAAFQTQSTNLGPADTNLLTDVYRTALDVPPPPPTGPVRVLPEPGLLPLMTAIDAAVPDLEVVAIDQAAGTFSVPGCAAAALPLPAPSGGYVSLMAGEPYPALDGALAPAATADCRPSAVTVFNVP